ncbi:hypothetical protein [Nocardioides sp. TF02-7]|uniref:DUF6912 family protein n=1 Tax=Nocardioides sp. TF02-7 TaxID=2917724 RepID=UPI001F05B36E|nr:hypothetical protein [Nocardioides sp. TF02-7]UMG91776.1 hypothetical protein MF408_17195 [Nocardioides sp. TF02-7]
MTGRVYVATTLDGLRDHVAAGSVPASAERVVVGEEDEELEYDALMTAAGLSAAAQPEGARRVVVVGEPSGDPEGDLPWREVVAVHADDRGGAGPDDDLAWYATQEVGALLG